MIFHYFGTDGGTSEKPTLEAVFCRSRAQMCAVRAALTRLAE
jgi:hypothetical protein